MNKINSKFLKISLAILLIFIGLIIIILATQGTTTYPSITSNTEWDIVAQEFDGVAMVLVPTGCFQMGSYNSGYSNEEPLNEVCFNVPFWIDKYEVSNAQFNQFGDTSQNDSRWLDDNLPRNLISWFEAETYCESRNARLPTEAEWEYAAKGNNNLAFSWGNDVDASKANLCDLNCNLLPDITVNDGFEYVAPVDAFLTDVSWVGAINMTGNVGEWVSTIYSDEFPYPYNPNDGRENLENIEAWRVYRGGNFNTPIDWARTSYRNGFFADGEYVDIGFRCMRSFE